MNKKIIIAILAMMIFVPLTYSYLTDGHSKVNALSAGYNTTAIVEDFPESELKKGESIKKVVQVKNNNSVDCYVRIFFGLDDMEKLDSLSFDFNEHWKKEGDYYYYDTILKAGELTEPLFTTITADDRFETTGTDIIIYEESVQSEHYENAIEAFEGIN